MTGEQRELLPELLVRALEKFELQYIERGYSSGYEPEHLARDLGVMEADNPDYGDWKLGWDIMAELASQGVLRRRGCRAVMWELVPEVKRTLIDQHNLGEKWNREAPYMHPSYEVSKVLDATRAVSAEEFPTLLPAVREQREECGCVTRDLKGGWTVFQPCCPEHAYKQHDFTVRDEDGDHLASDGTLRRALRRALEAARRPRRPPEALQVVARWPEACGCVRMPLACGWVLHRAHALHHGYYGEKWGVSAPGEHEEGSALTVGWGATKKEALAQAAELLERRAEDKEARHRAKFGPEAGQMTLIEEVG